MMPAYVKGGIGQVTALGSYNWAGYALGATTGSVSDVKGSWKVPAVLGALCATTSWHASSFWVGIDGFSSGTVEQTGTESDCYEGALSYYAWYEFYPAAPVKITSVPIKPGDTISAEVKFAGGKFTAILKDVTTAKSFTSPATAVSGALRSSAEWIAESPSGNIGVLPLADFGTVTFKSCAATVSGVTGTIAHFGSISNSITMVDFPAGTPVKASTSVLSSTGNSFSVKWLSAGPYG
jgi:hypothetical protein